MSNRSRLFGTQILEQNSFNWQSNKNDLVWCKSQILFLVNKKISSYFEYFA